MSTNGYPCDGSSPQPDGAPAQSAAKCVLLHSFAHNIVGQVDQKQTITQNLRSITGIYMGCGTSTTSACSECLKLGFEGSENGVCAAACKCSISNIDLDQQVQFNMLAYIDPGSIDTSALVNAVATDLQQVYGSVSDSTYTNITKIAGMIKEQSIQKAQQIATNVQGVVGQGIGYSMEDISMQTVVNALMQAIESLVDESGVSVIDNTAETINTHALNQVNSELSDGFKQAWNEVKSYVILTSILIVTMILGIIVLLLLRAGRQRVVV